MEKTMKSLIILCTALVLLMGCGEQKIQPVFVTEWQEYHDPGYGFTIRYPKDWKQLGTTGQAVFAKSGDVLEKFHDPRSGIEGAQVSVDVYPYAGKSPNDFIAQTMDELKGNNAEIDSGKSTNYGTMLVAGKESRMIPYRIQATTKTSIYGHYLFVPGDTAMYRLNFEGYGNQYPAHLMVFDSMKTSFQIPIVVAKKPDVWNPSPNPFSLKTNYFTMKYPENMEDAKANKGNNEFAMEVRADRYDCSIHVDVFGAKALTVDKVWEQNKARYHAKETGTTTIDGNKTYWVDYSLRKDVNSRAYFVVKNDKVIRITLNWFAPQKEIYFPVFEKSVTTMSLK